MQNTHSASDWRALVSRLIRSEMTKRNIKYEELSQKLEAQGTRQSASNLRNKINRGILGADLFIQIIVVMNVNQLDRSALIEILNNIEE